MKITRQSHPHKRANWPPTWDLPHTGQGPHRRYGTRSHGSQGRPAKLQMMLHTPKTASNRVHLRTHIKATGTRMNDGTSRAFAWESCLNTCTASALQRPPPAPQTCIFQTLQVLGMCSPSRGELAPTQFRLGLLHVAGLSPCAVSTPRRVTSIAN